MPWAKLNSTAVTTNEPPTASEPRACAGRAGAPRLRDEHDDGADDRDAEQPAVLAAERGVEEAERPGAAAEDADAPPPPRRAAALAGDAAEAVVAEDQREDAVVGGARDPRRGPPPA